MGDEWLCKRCTWPSSWSANWMSPRTRLVAATVARPPNRDPTGFDCDCRSGSSLCEMARL